MLAADGFPLPRVRVPWMFSVGCGCSCTAFQLSRWPGMGCFCKIWRRDYRDAPPGVSAIVVVGYNIPFEYVSQDPCV